MRINNPIGVITKKYIIPMTIGAITFPRSSPNLIQAKFKGVSNFELIKPKIRKIIEIASDHTLTAPPSIINAAALSW